MNGKEAENLLSEAGSRASGICRDEERHGGDAKDTTAPEPYNMEGAIGETETEIAPGARSDSAKRGGSRNVKVSFGWSRESSPKSPESSISTTAKASAATSMSKKVALPDEPTSASGGPGKRAQWRLWSARSVPPSSHVGEPLAQDL